MGTLTSSGTQATATGHLLNLRTGFAGSSWNGNGIITSTGVGSDAIAWSEASALNGGTTAFSGQTVDNTSVLMKFTHRDDYNFDGQTNINDFSILGPVPPMPDNLSARGIPEPAMGVALAALFGVRRRRRSAV